MFGTFCGIFQEKWQIFLLHDGTGLKPEMIDWKGIFLCNFVLNARFHSHQCTPQPRYTGRNPVTRGGSLGLTLREALKTSGGCIQRLWYFTIAFLPLLYPLH